MILVDRLKIILQEFIHEDRSGFLPRKYLRDNVQAALNILECLEKQN